MNILYTCDNNYIWLMGISMTSLLENNKDLSDLKVYLLGDNITEASKKVLRDIGIKHGRDIIIIDVPPINIPQSLVSARWPISAFTRLFSGQLLPKTVDKILYMDCDTIVAGSIKELGGIELDKNHIFYGIKDCVSGSYKKNIGLNAGSMYINAGVLLIDLEALRRVDVNDSIQKYMEKYEKVINYADQDLLNGVFHDKIMCLDPKFNVMTIAAVHSYKEIQMLRKPTNYYSKEELEYAVCNPVIIHYTTNMRVVRPWYRNTNHPLADVFKKYLRISPWKDRVLNEMHFTSKEAKIIGLIQILPRDLANRVLGIIHAEIKPWLISRKAK